MKFVRIFGNNLVSVKYSDTDTAHKTYTSEWDKIFSQWKDLTYINNFFKQKRIANHLASSYNRKNGITAAVARMQVYRDAIFVRKRILEICEAMVTDESENLDMFFRPLNNKQTGERPLQHTKHRKRLIAIYAIRISANHYVLTGGAIKLVHMMDEQEETNHQLSRLKQMANYLKEEGAIDEEAYYELILDEL